MTQDYSRRQLLGKLAAGMAAIPLASGAVLRMEGSTLNMPIGLQLYTVGKEMEEDPRGTLKQVAADGYRVVELSPLANSAPKNCGRCSTMWD